MQSRGFPKTASCDPQVVQDLDACAVSKEGKNVEPLMVKGFINCDEKPVVGTREGTAFQACRVCANLSFLSNCLQTSLISTLVVR